MLNLNTHSNKCDWWRIRLLGSIGGRLNRETTCKVVVMFPEISAGWGGSLGTKNDIVTRDRTTRRTTEHF